MENIPEDFVYAHFPFVDVTDSSSSETDIRAEASNNEIKTGDLIDPVNQNLQAEVLEDNICINVVDSNRVDSKQLSRNDLHERTSNNLIVGDALSEKNLECKIENAVGIREDRVYSSSKENIFNNLAFAYENDEDVNNGIPRDVAITNEHMGQTANNITTQESNTEKTNDKFYQNGNGKLRRLCSDKIFRTKVLRTIFILWNYTIFVSTFNRSVTWYILWGEVFQF